MQSKKTQQGKNKYLILGIILILSSGLAFALMLTFPFLPIDGRARMIGSTASLVAMEVLFWTGSLLTGKELISRYKDKLNPRKWFRKPVKDQMKDDDSLSGE